MKLVLFVTLFAVVAQVLPSCDGNKEIVGWVEEKLIDRSGGGPEYVIVINSVWHEVPFAFYQSVDVGDLVKYDGRQWTIVRKSGS